MSEDNTEFDLAGKEVGNTNFLKEIIGFLMQNKKWWMLPIIFVVLCFGLLIVLGGTGAAPFIYTLF